MKKATRIILGLVFIVTILFSIPAFAREIRTSSIQPNGNIVERYEGEREGASKIARELYKEYGKRISAVWIRLDEQSSKICVSIEPKVQKKCVMAMEILADREQLRKELQVLKKEDWKITEINPIKIIGGEKNNKVFCSLKKTIKY